MSMLALILSTIISGVSAYTHTMSLGANMHIDRTDGQWQNRPFLTALLKAEGIKYVRSSLAILGNSTYSAYLQQLDDQDKADAIRSDEIIGPGLSCSQITGLLTIWGVVYTEGPNELNLNDSNWINDDNAQTTTTSTCNVSKNIPMIAPSVVNTDPAQIASSVYSYGNEHDYTSPYIPETTGWGGPVYGQIYGSEAYNIAAANRAASGKPVIATEYGYDSSVLLPTTQASYDERMMLVHDMNGITKQFLYDLVDDNQSFGLADLNGNMKPVAFGMEGLNAILNDTSQFSGACNITATITPPQGVTVDAFVYCKASGEKDLVVWQPAQLQDPSTLNSTPATPASVTITLTPSGTTRLYTQTPGYQWLENDSPVYANGAYTALATERPFALAINAGAPVVIPLLPSP